jgi:hypothetical protein
MFAVEPEYAVDEIEVHLSYANGEFECEPNGDDDDFLPENRVSERININLAVQTLRNALESQHESDDALSELAVLTNYVVT